MTPDPPLARLCQVIDSAPDPRALLRAIAPLLRDLTGCDHVSLVLAANGLLTGPGLAVESADAAHVTELPAESLPHSAAAWVHEHRRLLRLSPDSTPDFDEERRLFGQGYRICVYQPLLARREVVGVLGLAARRDDAPAL